MREEVRLKYAESALGLREECCDVTGGLYTDDEISSLPEAAASSSLGCGNPTAVAELREGETVLDLGSGGGIDVILSARRVGTSGFAYGVDMTEEMLELARKNAREAGVGNVEFLEGLIEDIPLEAETVDVIISNCVINLAVDKPAGVASRWPDRHQRHRRRRLPHQGGASGAGQLGGLHRRGPLDHGVPGGPCRGRIQ
jgi:SAM-dependent methyltransferase